MKCPKCNSELIKYRDMEDDSSHWGCDNDECNYTVFLDSESNIEKPVDEEKEYPVEDEV